MNMQGLMQQTQRIKEQMKRDQQSIFKHKFTGKASKNLVTVVVTGDHQVQNIKIAPKVVKSKDSGMISDLITEALNNTNKQISKKTQDVMGKYTRDIPGM